MSDIFEQKVKNSTTSELVEEYRLLTKITGHMSQYSDSDSVDKVGFNASRQEVIYRELEKRGALHKIR